MIDLVHKLIKAARAMGQLAANDVIRIALQNNGTLFGGYLRDTIGGRQAPTDVDLWFNTEDSASKFVMEIAKRLDLHLSSKRQRERFKHFRINSPGLTDVDHVDIVVCPDRTIKLTDRIDVNMLLFDNDGLRVFQPSKDKPGDLWQVIEHIKGQVFQQLGDPPPPSRRLQKMSDMGWQPAKE